MEWNRVAIETNDIGAEIATAILIAHGITGMEIIDPRERSKFLRENTGIWDYAEDSLLSDGDGKTYVVFYINKNNTGKQQAEKIKNALQKAKSRHDHGAIGSMTMSTEPANSADWENEWKKHFKPIRIGKLTIIPEWETHTLEPDSIPVLIDPGSAFGTGQHKSTQLAIKALSDIVQPGMSVLDIGCGSGILSVVSLLLGAKACLACDIDEYNAVYATKQNAALNNIKPSQLEVLTGDALSDEDLINKITNKKFDIVVANIVADVVSALAPLAHQALKPGGHYITTGIISEKKHFVENSIQAAGFTISNITELDGWALIAGVSDA